MPFSLNYLRLQVTIEEFKSIFFDVTPSEENPLGLGDIILRPRQKDNLAPEPFPEGKTNYSLLLRKIIFQQVKVNGEALVSRSTRSPFEFKTEPPYIRFTFCCCMCGVKNKKSNFNIYAERLLKDGAINIVAEPHVHVKGELFSVFL